MKVSVCIPVYQQDIRALILGLSHEIVQHSLAIEICLIDYGSKKSIRTLNREIAKCCSLFLELEQNIGRSAIRNLFWEQAKGDYLLFLDCDIAPISPSFLRNYLKAINQSKSKLICGGHQYPQEKPEKAYRLKWLVGKHRESRPINKRKICGWKSFMPSNFIIEKKLFANVKFDERLKGYGHEDSLFAFKLFEIGIISEHIHNPVLITDKEDNEVFLEKTKQGVKNLAHVNALVNQSKAFTNGIRLLWVLSILEKLKIRTAISLFLSPLEPILEKGLKTGNLGLFSFDLFKLIWVLKSIK